MFRTSGNAIIVRVIANYEVHMLRTSGNAIIVRVIANYEVHMLRTSDNAIIVRVIANYVDQCSFYELDFGLSRFIVNA